MSLFTQAILTGLKHSFSQTHSYEYARFIILYSHYRSAFECTCNGAIGK